MLLSGFSCSCVFVLVHCCPLALLVLPLLVMRGMLIRLLVCLIVSMLVSWNVCLIVCFALLASAISSLDMFVVFVALNDTVRFDTERATCVCLRSMYTPPVPN